MMDPSTCPVCGTPLAQGSRSGMCPTCLLQAAMGGDSTLHPGPGDEGAAPVAPQMPEQPGTRIGHYKLLEQIGEGGFGVVWMAEQEEPVRRRVALKIIKPGMDTREVVARFEAERQALAMMEHPNIASVFDGGATDTGRPYFVMELVKGVPITTYCDVNQLTTRERLELFMEVCHAVQHAHQKGVIHRDLKPSNILVTVKDDHAVPKVIDFGIAKATQATLTEKTLFTRLNQWLGTPEYMSPEQAGLGSLDVDTRSDIYSLGVLLYELLTGRPPFDTQRLLAAGYDAVMRTIREEEPPKPSTRLSALTAEELGAVAAKRGSEPAKLNRLVCGDLDWIVMKSLEKDRRRRYETANGFADDLRRHLDNEVVSATPPSMGYQLRKFARRSRTALSVAAGIAALLVAATVVSSWLAVRATRAEELARVQAERATAAEAMAKQRLAESEAISQFLTSAFQSPDPARDGRTITVAEMLDNAAKKLDTDLADQPARRASLQSSIGSTYHALGLSRDAIPLREKVLDYHRAAGGPEHPDTLKAMDCLASSYFVAGRLDEAIELQEQVLKLSDMINGPEHLTTLGAINNLALSCADIGRWGEALKLREKVERLMRKVHGPEHPDTLTAMSNLALSYDDAGRRDDALKLRDQVVQLRFTVNGPAHPNTLGAMANLAISFSAVGRRAEAFNLRENVLSLCRQVLGPEHPDTLKAMGSLANSHAEMSRRDAALSLREEVLTLSRKVNGPEHPDTLEAMHNLALSLSGAGRADDALKLQEEALRIMRKVYPPKHPTTLKAMANLASSFFEVGRRDEALKLREEALQLMREVLGSAHPNTRGEMGNLANSYLAAGRLDEAIKLLEEQDNPQTQYYLGWCFLRGKFVEKDEAEAVKWLRKAASQNHADAQYNLGVCYRDGQGVAKDEAAAVEWFRKAAEQNHPLAQYNLGSRYYTGLGVEKDAAAAVEWFLKAAGQNLAEAQFNLGSCYFKGLGVAQDHVEAYKWLLLADAQGLETAKDVMAGLKPQLTPEQQAEGSKRALAFKPQEGPSFHNPEREASQPLETPPSEFDEAKAKAETGDASAQNNLGVYYIHGRGVAKDEANAVEWFRKAAAQGQAEAQCNLGICYDKGCGVAKDASEAAKWLRKSADQDNAEAQCQLGFHYCYGQGVIKDYAAALEWYRRSAAQNFAEAQYNLGICYRDGFAVKKDEVEAVKWFRLAAGQNNALAQNALAFRYYTGQGVAQDYREAVKWYRQAAAQDCPEAQFGLGGCYLNGLGVVQDPVEAYKWVLLASAQGFASARQNLPLLERDLTPEQLAEGRKRASAFKQPEGPPIKIKPGESGGNPLADLHAIAASGDPKAQYELGEAFQAGKLGVPKNAAEALRWFRQAAVQNHPAAQANLGICYERGDGVAKDELEAYKWYLLAAAQGDENAKDNASLLELLLSLDQIAEGKRRANQFKPQERTQP
ncbi:MAG: tetratricopeptide repeat protein [Verrucomicrobia bacterium]|nr:tetratricopeptide repeat protein [Verrucomicrobiota bacterium]